MAISVDLELDAIIDDNPTQQFIGRDVYINVLLTQSYDDMGMFSDLEFEPSRGVIEPLTLKDKFNERRVGKFIEAYYTQANYIVTTSGSSRLTEFKKYGGSNYQPGYVIRKEVIDGVEYVDKLVSYFSFGDVDGGEELQHSAIYAFSAKNDAYIGTPNQTGGVWYEDTTDAVIIHYMTAGYNETNSTLSAIYKKDHILGVANILPIENNISFNRMGNNIFKDMSKFGEINNLTRLEQYGNGYFNIIE